MKSSKINAAKLRRVIKGVQFRHVFLNSTRLFMALQRGFLKDYKKYKYFTLYACGLCKLAMHTELIRYNRKHKILYAASGAAHLMDMFPAQTRGGLNALEEFYRKFGIELLHPVYNETDVDKKVVELGLMEAEHTKEKHKISSIMQWYVPLRNIYNNIQGFCFWIPFIDMYHYSIRKKITKEKVSGIAADYYNYKAKTFCENYLCTE